MMIPTFSGGGLQSVAGLTGAPDAGALRTALSLATGSAVAFSSLALGGATIGANALAVTGAAEFSAAGKFLGLLTVQGVTANDIITLSTSGTVTGGTNTGGIKYQLVAAASPTVRLASDGVIGWNSTTNLGSGSIDLTLYRDGAADTLAQRRLENSQTHHHYDRWASATDYHRLATKTARATLSGVSGATVTATGLIPEGAVVLGVTTKVTTGLGTSNGTTGYQVGDGVDADRWGDITGTAAGTTSDNRDWTATTVQAFTAANDLMITAVGGNFDGTGTIYVSIQYLIGECD